MQQFYEIQNVLTAPAHEAVLRALNRLRWDYNPDTAYPGDGLASFGCHIWRPEQAPPADIDIWREPLIQATQACGITVQEIIRIRAGLIPQQTLPQTHPAHVDYTRPHWLMLYYPEDSDGATVLYDHVHPGGDQPTGPRNFEPIHEILPRANRAVILNGLQYHASSAPVTSRVRRVINYNFC